MLARLALLGLCLLIALPAASAQLPDAGDAVDDACALVAGAAPDVADALPVCPREEPAAPQAAQAEAAAPAPAPPAPEDAQQLADEAAGEVQGIAEDPTTAPDRVAALVATLVQFVKDAIGVPVDAAQGALDAAKAAVASAADAAEKGADNASQLVSGLVADARALVASVFGSDPLPATPSAPKVPSAKRALADAGGLLDGVAGIAGR